MENSLILLSGQTKAGKSVIAEAITYLDDRYKQVAFADILKQDFADTFDVPLADLHDISLKDVYRPGIVRYADEQRAVDPLKYVRGLFDMLDAFPGYYVIDDVRCVEELQWGLERGGKPYRVYAEDNVRKFRGWKPNPKIDQHYLEQELILSAQTYRALGGDWIHNNTNSLDDAMNRAYSLLRTLHKIR